MSEDDLCLGGGDMCVYSCTVRLVLEDDINLDKIRKEKKSKIGGVICPYSYAAYLSASDREPYNLIPHEDLWRCTVYWTEDQITLSIHLECRLSVVGMELVIGMIYVVCMLVDMVLFSLS